MKNRIRLLALIICPFILKLAIPVYASDIQSQETQNVIDRYYELKEENSGKANVHALLTDSSGVDYAVDVYASKEKKVDENVYQLEYSFKLSFEDTEQLTDGFRDDSTSQTSEGWDVTGGVYGNFKINYVIQNEYEYLLTSVVPSWAIYDWNISLSNMYTIYFCVQPNYYYQNSIQNVYTSGTPIYTGFSSYVNAYGASALGGRFYATINRSGSSWGFSLECIKFNNTGI